MTEIAGFMTGDTDTCEQFGGKGLAFALAKQKIPAAIRIGERIGEREEYVKECIDEIDGNR